MFEREENILGDPGADSRGEGKSKRAGKYGAKKSKERREENVLPDQFQTVAAVLPSGWCQKTLCFSAQSEGRTAATV